MLLLPPIKCKGAQMTGTSKMGTQKTIFQCKSCDEKMESTHLTGILMQNLDL